MDVLVIHDEAISRVRVARALQAAAHRVTLSESVDEAEEMLKFVESEKEAPAVILIAEKMLGERSAHLRRRLAERFDELMWIPLRHDLEVGWVARWLEKLESAGVRHRRRDALNVVLLEANHGLRRAIAGSLTASGDSVVACGSVAQARTFLESLANRDMTRGENWVLVAPVICRGAESISLYLAARRRLPNLRWVVLTPDKQAAAKGSRPAERRLADLETVRRRIADPER